MRILQEMKKKNQRLQCRIQHHQNLDSQLDKILADLMNTHDAEILLQIILNCACELMGTQHGYIYLVNNAENFIEVKVAKGYYKEIIGKKLCKGEEISGKIWQNSKCIVTYDYSQMENRNPDPKRDIVHGWIGLPLMDKDNVLGVFCLAYLDGKRKFDKSNIRLLQRFVNLATVALCNAQLYTKLQAELAEKMRIEENLRLSNERWQLAVHGTNDGVWDWDITTGKVHFSERFRKMLGYTDEELAGNISEWRKIVHPEDYSQFVEKLHDYFNKKSLSFRVEYRIRCKGNKYRWMLSRAQAVWNEAGEPIRVVGFQTDITDSKVVEDKLRLAAKIHENVQEGIAVTDQAGNVILVNPAFTTITGYEADEVIGKNLRLLKSGQHDKQFYQELWANLRSNGNWQGEIWNKRKNGEIFAENLSISAIADENGQVTQFVAIFSDITNRKLYEAQLEHQATHDKLTDLPNRWLLHQRIPRVLEQARNAGQKVAVIFLDVDGFKQVNDLWGHEMGDILLAEIGQRLTDLIRVTDTLGRLGGDEFVILLPNVRSQQDVGVVAKKICHAFEMPFIINGNVIQVTCSVGISISPGDGERFDVLLKNADYAMYAAKQGGKNHFIFYDQLVGKE